MPRIQIFTLGGTIAMAPGQGGVLPELSGADLVAAVPELESLAELKVETVQKVASANLGVEAVLALAAKIEAARAAGVDGVVVAQGTDTLEENAFLLDVLLADGCPVVVTGALRNPTLLSADGPANLRDAAHVALRAEARGGVTVVLNGEIHAARFVHKRHTFALEAFSSAPAGPLGWVTEGRPHFATRPLRAGLHLSLAAGQPVPYVAIYATFGGDDGRLLRSLEDADIAGLVLQSLGTGHVPAALVEGLARLAARMPVVMASRIPTGDMFTRTYAYAGGEVDLLGRGLISSGTLSVPKARALLAALLASGADWGAIEAAFGKFS